MQNNRPANHLVAFSLRLKSLIEEKNWSAADLAREASKHVPETHRKRGKQYVIGRHLISSYCRGENEPAPINLKYICQALNVEPNELLPLFKKRRALQTAQAISSLEGKTRLLIDMELDTDLAMKILNLVRDNVAGD
ncbi:helix-turn-helix transcriptional regulator [Tardiphaga sp. vice304]|uniref:helix-turn-helix domain-containing protein n=1 Tax=Tardiphaga sp. vice304 TaxID=2592817 RepID=UPI001165B9A6|nr:helix-turn-helix transcriptional regulator [Tardiphaga sp. vice304]QDM25634.1 helix-turn-helix transcriptional regulator [Tardiphaga sp. vice304]